MRGVGEEEEIALWESEEDEDKNEAEEEDGEVKESGRGNREGEWGE